MLAICWDHWRPEGWPRLFPYEVFLYFFLVMTGFLITGSLLRQRDRREAEGKPWRAKAMRVYQVRRSLRILAPYYAALALSWLVWAPDVHDALGWYVLHLSNIHMATLPEWPPGTNHFWSLAMQQQFYFIWPFVIWFVPKRWLAPVILLVALAGPLTRMADGFFAQWFARPYVMTWACLDYFGVGGLLALARHRGMSLESPGLRLIALAGLVGYLVIFCAGLLDLPAFGMRPWQQTFLSLALCGFIATGIVGFSGWPGKLLENPGLQRVGEVSYGIYLYHNLAPLAAGKILPFLWFQPFQNPAGALLRVAVFWGVTWGLTLLSWRWIEQPMQGLRERMAGR